MIGHVAGFELKYQLRSPMFWGAAIIFLVLAFVTVSSDTLRIGWGGQVYRNAPYAIAAVCMAWSIFGIFLVTAFVPGAVLRDDESGFGAILQATRLTPTAYLFGRFIGSFGAAALAFLSVPLGALLAVLVPGADPDTVGPIRLTDYLYAYALLSLPTLFVLSGLFFALATITRSLVASYVGALVTLALYFFVSLYLGRPEIAAGATLIDLTGIASVEFETRNWTAHDRNAMLPPLLGLLLQNRAIWFALALVALGLAWRLFARAGFRARVDRRPARGGGERAETSSTAPLGAPSPPSRRDLVWGPLAALTRFELAAVLRGPTFLVLLGVALISMVANLWLAGDDKVSTIFPVTRVMVQTLNAYFINVPLFVAAFYAGELVWRDREQRIHDITGSTPSPDWAFLVPKIAAIVLLMLAMGTMAIVAAVLVQLAKGFTDIQFGLYLTWFLGPWLLTMALYAVLAVFVQVLAPHKFVGLLIMLLFFIAQLSLPRMGVESHLLIYATTPPVPLSDINGTGAFAGHAAWYRAYWAAAAVVLAVLANLLWRRGGVAPLMARLKLVPGRLKSPAGAVAAVAALVMAGTGGWIYYNNYVLNDFPTARESERWAADYERTLMPLEAEPQPRITDVKLDVALHPELPRAEIRGSYLIENRTAAPLSTVHVYWPQAYVSSTAFASGAIAPLRMLALQVEGARVARDLPRFHFRTFAFDAPMQPGERRTIRFHAVREQRGFRNAANDDRIVANGTFLDNFLITPGLGVSRAPLLTDRAVRRRHGLSPELVTTPLEDPRGRAHNYFRHDSDFVRSDITVSGPADQVLIAPGKRVSDRVVADRRVARFVSEAPMLNFFSIQAARYAVARDRWKDVDIEVYYHPVHRYNIDRMRSIVKDGLAYYSANFGPYQFSQFRIVEAPAYRGASAQAFPGTIAYSEAAGFLTRIDEAAGIDFITYFTAHELAHQWWAHQLVGADMQGSAMLSEAVAQYSALMVMEKRYGPAMIGRFLRQAQTGYLTARGNENSAEPTLERVEGQGYVRYDKGGVVMYLLKDRVGEAAVNRALRKLLAQHRFKGAPYATARDLVTALRAEVGPAHDGLITDLFQRITLYDLKVTDARTSRRPDGKWAVALTVEARKRYADGSGREREAPLDAVIDVGLFTGDPAKAAFRRDNVVAVRTERLTTGQHRLNFVTDRQPRFAGVDPFFKYIDRDTTDNVRPVTVR